ncbi:hypothetical protein LTR08_003914 [Meristemomyces frigidus]|nr:hypothetical protein LTR08_003914 [Meristemomyces frigidus]
MPSIDTADLFEQEAFSDITIQSGNRQFKVHKLVICQHEYFNSLCGPNTPFAERNQQTIELKDDNEDAVAAMLRWIYTSEYDTTWAGFTIDAFLFHVKVYSVADKYQLLPLKLLAKKRINTVMASCTTDTLFAMTKFEGVYGDRWVLHWLGKCDNQRLKAMLHHGDFLDYLKDDGELSGQIIALLRDRLP